MKINDIEKLEFDVLWQIKDIEIPCLGEHKTEVFFDYDQIVDGKHYASIPPTKRQLETLLYISKLPKSFIKKARDKIIKNCELNLSVTDYGYDLHIDMKQIEKYYRLNQISIPLQKRTDIKNFILLGDCAWESEHGLGILCRNDKIIDVGAQCEYL